MTEDEPYRLDARRTAIHACDIKRRNIAMKIDISDCALHDCLKSATWMSFSKYINHLRLANARELIETIATESGFNFRITKIWTTPKWKN